MADARDTKNGKAARQYIQPELAIELQAHISKKLGGSQVFQMPHPSTVVDIFREDMERARTAWLKTVVDAQERIEAEQGDFLKGNDSEGEQLDFHSLRHTTATWLIQAGADIKTVQSVMRHSDIKLTLDRYGHLFPGAEADAVARMREAFIQPARLTGTSDHPQQFQQHSGREGVRQGAKGRHSEALQIDRFGHEKTLVSQRFTEKNQGLGAMRALGLEPRTQGLKVPCSTN